MGERFDARALRKRMTPAERRLWAVLRDGRLDGVTFRRQHPAGRFILDFYSPSAALVIELDGPIHAYQAEYDTARTVFLEECGARVIRFTNDEVLCNLPSVLARIQGVLRETTKETPPPTPSPLRWRGVPSDAVSESVYASDLDDALATAPLHRSGEGVGGGVLSDILTIAFDVYGTLVDPLAMHEHLVAIVGPDRAGEAAALWRRTQLEYSFRRGLMGPEYYVDFDQCTAQALHVTLMSSDVDPNEETRNTLLAAYTTLPAFPDSLPGLTRVRDTGHRLLAFSNGPEASVRAVLDHAGVLPLLDGVVSVDDLRTFKPNPAVYGYLVERGGRRLEETWLVTANAWDAIGAKAAGLRVAWLRRNPAAIFDPWEDVFTPDAIVGSLRELPF